jgi:hypothetical protein
MSAILAKHSVSPGAVSSAGVLGPGDEVGNKGQWTLHDNWFDEHVYTIIVHQRHVPTAILQRFEEEPTELPVWYPGAEGIRFQNP